MKTGVLLVNLGTPNSPSTSDVRKYLTEFLNDPFVIDFSYLKRFFLVNFIIVPFRSPKTAALYKEIWTDKGSPLMFNSYETCYKLQESLGDDYYVELAMRYQQPSIQSILAKLIERNVDKIVCIPLYPQYTTSASESSLQKVQSEYDKLANPPPITYIKQFYEHPDFIASWVQRAREHKLDEYDHVLFSYHGLPERHLTKQHGQGNCDDYHCKEEINESNHHCYRATCYDTTRKIVKELNLAENFYTISFQSRLGKDPWLKPYTDHELIKLAQSGVKRILVFSPSFVADCLETLYEISIEYNELFQEHGGEKVQLIESLNGLPRWIATLKDIVEQNTSA
ncbi:MAG: ferrochelatase [Bacteroidetes bacterium]|nr:MAG: ferrochelatase [Bacteroidota bacterium]